MKRLIELIILYIAIAYANTFGALTVFVMKKLGYNGEENDEVMLWTLVIVPSLLILCGICIAIFGIFFLIYKI